MIIRWLHLSDFHVGKDNYEQVRLFEKILEEIERRKDEGFVPDYVFLTGDIANKGAKKEYEMFRSGFLTPLQEMFGVETVVIAVPGNHDVARPSPDGLDRDALLKPSKLFDASKEGKSARDQVLPRFKPYKQTMSTTGMSPDWLAFDKAVAIHKRELTNKQVGVIGLNTAWLSKGDDDKNKLTPGHRLVDAALKELSQCDIKIVLGHHPLNWWHDDEEQQIRRLFAEHHVIYLHGHKHKAEGRFEEGGADQFLVLQAGAAFQAREGDKWVNGFTWGEIDPAAAEVRISPIKWVNREWKPDFDALPNKRRIDQTDWFRFPLPGASTALARIAKVDTPPGWMRLDAKWMAEQKRDITQADAQRFFDGAEPTWALAQSPHFPVRHQAKPLLESVIGFRGEDRPQIAWVRGPTAEGKSMLLRQLVARALEEQPTLQVLWHQDENQGLNAQSFEALLMTDARWLVVSEHGHGLVRSLQTLASRLKQKGQCHVQFLMAAHDSDWKLVKADSIYWSQFSQYDEVNLSGLPPEDAQAIAQTWLHFGSQMNSAASAHHTPEALAQEMLLAAKDEGAQGSAFFGALLTLRYGHDLKGHVRALMEKFDALPVQGGGTVGQAFHYIAAMHAQGFEFLSTKVLAKTMGCDEAVFKRDVRKPLSDEAATGTGQFLRTRHHKIAATVLQLCEDEDIDLKDLYLPLVEAAILSCRVEDVWMDEIANWEYDLTKHFAEIGRKDLAIAIAEKMHGTAPNNSHYVVKLARLRRENKDFPGAINALKALTPPPQNNRAYWLEWGMVSGKQEKWLANAALHAYSISDDLKTQLTDENVVKAFNGLAMVFDQLNKKTNQQNLLNARNACLQLGLFIDPKNQDLLKTLKNFTNVAAPSNMQEGVQWFQEGLATVFANDTLEPEYIELIGTPRQFQFNTLKSLLANTRNGPNG